MEKLLEGKEALEFCIECGKDAGEWVTENMLNLTFVEDHDLGIYKPQDLEYEKTFFPFILISKKRYVGNLFEFDPNSCKRKSMGIVLKRRDNAYIVKHVFGNVIEKVMNDKNLEKTVDWLKQTLEDIRSGKFSIRYFIITKDLCVDIIRIHKGSHIKYWQIEWGKETQEINRKQVIVCPLLIESCLKKC